jgi:sulfate permease, SulP family
MLTLAPLARFVPRAALAGLLVVTAYRLVEWRRIANAFRASRYDGALILSTALCAIFVSVEFSVLIGVAVSLVLFMPRAAHIVSTELVVGADRVIRRAREGDPRCRLVTIYDVEGELFFGAAPELDQLLARIRANAGGARVAVLRLRRSRNPDLVCVERLEHFCRDMSRGGIPVVLSGLRPDLMRPDLMRAIRGLGFDRWIPSNRIFPSAGTTSGSSTVAAVREAYRIAHEAGPGGCPHCTSLEIAGDELYYLV